jgi:predicted nucleic acid-binding protein
MKKTFSDLVLLDVNVLFALAWPNPGHAYLLHLARSYNATFITFDGKLKSLAGSTAHTEVIGF